MEYKFKQYTFETEEMREMAKKEAEIIQYLKLKSDFNNKEALLKLYKNLLLKDTFHTQVGFDFLKELEGILGEAAEPVKNAYKFKKSGTEVEKTEVKKEIQKKPFFDKPVLSETEKLKRQNKYLSVSVVALLLIIVGMIVIFLLGEFTPISAIYEERILNKYAGWQQELTEQEKEINEKILFLEENGIHYEK